MRRYKPGLWPFLFFALLQLFPEAMAGDRIKVVTTIPTLRDFVTQVGGEKIEVVSLLKGGEDLHTFDPRPSDTRAVFGADILVKVGIGLDGWVDKIIKASGNRRLRVVEASQGVEVIRSPGENISHISGNPHVWHDPGNARVMLKNIYNALTGAFPQGESYFRANLETYTAKLTALDKELDGALSEIKDRRVVTYHPGWAYLVKRFSLRELFSIERSPGREPSAREMADSIDTIKKEKVKLILGEPEAPRKVLFIISKESGAAVVNLAPEVGSLPGTGSYMGMMRHNVGEIARGLSLIYGRSETEP